MSGAASGPLTRTLFGRLADGGTVERVRLAGRDGFAATVITYGARVQSLLVPDRDGRIGDVVLGHDDLAGYLSDRRHFGATIGRYANRIAGGSFTLDGRRYDLARNNGPNTLHGGARGFDVHTWTIAETGEAPEPFVTLARVSPDGEEGFPGRLTVSVTYRVIAGSGLAIAFEAGTDAPTVVNLTHHGYFNLAGGPAAADALGHELMVAADTFLPTDAGAIPLGAPRAVAGTPFDFRHGGPVGARIRADDAQLLLAHGYDHTFCLAGGRTEAPRPVARLAHPGSGRVLELATDQPGLQVYSGNFLDGSDRGKGGRLYRQSDAVCLEPQLWPDSPNRPDYPSARLDPGETYRHVTEFRFGVA